VWYALLAAASVSEQRVPLDSNAPLEAPAGRKLWLGRSSLAVQLDAATCFSAGSTTRCSTHVLHSGVSTFDHAAVPAFGVDATTTPTKAIVRVGNGETAILLPRESNDECGVDFRMWERTSGPRP